MSIAPPPGVEDLQTEQDAKEPVVVAALTVAERKRQKKIRQRENKRRKQEMARAAEAKEFASKAQLREDLHDRMNLMRSKRTGTYKDMAEKAQAQMQRNKINPQDLMNSMGLTNPTVQQKVLGRVQRGEISTMDQLLAAIQKHVKL